MTFSELDRLQGNQPLPDSKTEEFPLPEWYRNVYEIPLNQFGVDDLAKACRHEIHLDDVVPLVLNVLENSPMAGEFFDGELLISMRWINPTFWTSSPKLAERLINIVTLSGDELDKSFTSDLELLRKNVRPA